MYLIVLYSLSPLLSGASHCNEVPARGPESTEGVSSLLYWHPSVADASRRFPLPDVVRGRAISAILLSSPQIALKGLRSSSEFSMSFVYGCSLNFHVSSGL
jgi:hypothetical protein